MSDETQTEQGIAITSVIVIPRNQHYCKYVINEGSIHTKKYDDLEDFLVNLVPEKSQRIIELLRTFRHFMVIVPTKEVDEFHFDFSGQRDILEREVKRALRTKLPPEFFQRTSTLSEKTDFVISSNYRKLDKK